MYLTDDYNRVVLEPEEGVPDSDYINASYVDVSIFFMLIPSLLFPKCIPIFCIMFVFKNKWQYYAKVVLLS